MTRPRLMILGHARHGKDTAAEWLAKNHDYKFVSSSWFMCERVVWKAIHNSYEREMFLERLTPAQRLCREREFVEMRARYADIQQCYVDRANYRGMWYDLIAAYNGSDPARLTKAIFAEGNDIYVGLRNARELHTGRLQKAFDLAIWIDASLRCPPENKSSCTVEPWMADVIVDNNGTMADLDKNMEFLYNGWIRPLERRTGFTGNANADIIS